MKKKIAFLALALGLTVSAMCQQAYWVFLTDKAGSSFDPYTYFDAKAIERYRQCGADLYDISNYPLVQAYVDGVSALATEEIGCSRWMNAMGVMATPEQALRISELPYVLRVQMIEGDAMQTCSYEEPLDGLFDVATVEGPLEAQLVRMGGKAFRDKGIDGKGIRIAVFDGGFPQVNTHDAFRHLRDNHQILKTWNFPKDKEDVYGWNSHGTMTLSCIAGRIGGKDLGLATGAEFLLARTEVNAEPFKEEVWWQMAVEWADRNGANIISSSLGYGKERHYTTDMDGTSYVAKAANMAARKGMLVVNSAGNEADSRQWKTIITPADADSVLCVGGIENSLTEYNHIEFSSYGPSADGRQKPNVCAFGYAHTADVGDDHASHYVHGTSFSCPLVAGFAACAWQASPGKSCMEMFREIERSADLYPYCDYAFGYGVPQAEYFCEPDKAKQTTPTFRFVDGTDSVYVVPTHVIKHKYLFYSFRRPYDNRLDYYGKMNIAYMEESDSLAFAKSALFDMLLTVNLAGYTDSVRLDEAEFARYKDSSRAEFLPKMSEEAVITDLTGSEGDLKIKNFGSCSKYSADCYFGLAMPITTSGNELAHNIWSPSWRFGIRLLRSYSKSYSLGLGLDFGATHYRFNGRAVNDLEASLGITQSDINSYKEVINRSHVFREKIGIELFQRVRLVPLGMMGHGLHWDLGIYGTIGGDDYTLGGKHNAGVGADYSELSFTDVEATDTYHLNYGISTRLTYDYIGIFARYRLSGIGKSLPAGKILLPRLEVGLMIQF